MDNFIVESMMFEHQIQCEIDQCFIEMREYIFDENADIMLEEAQNKKEGIIDKLIRRVRELIQKIKDWFSKLTKNEQAINKKIEKVEEAIEQNPEIGNQPTENINIPKLVDDAISESKKGSNKKSIKEILLGAAAVGVTVGGIIGWVKSGINTKAIRRLQRELEIAKKKLEQDSTQISDILHDYNEESLRAFSAEMEVEKLERKNADLKNENNKLNYKLKDSQQRAGKRIKEQDEKIDNMNKNMTNLNLQVTLLTQALTTATQEANKQIQVATTGKPSTTTTKRSGENTAPSTNGAPKTREEKNKIAQSSREGQAKRNFTNFIKTILKEWEEHPTNETKDVIKNLMLNCTSEADVAEKLKNINPKPSNPARIPKMIMQLKNLYEEYQKERTVSK